MGYAKDGANWSLMTLTGHFTPVGRHRRKQDHRQITVDQVGCLYVNNIYVSLKPSQWRGDALKPDL